MFDCSQGRFLSDPQNKQNFLQLLGDNLQMTGCDVFHATSDADVLIVQKAIESADNQDTTLVGDDTDLLVLLLYHTKLTSYNLFFAPEPRKNAKKVFGISRKPKTTWGLSLANIFSFCMLF